MKRFTLSCFLFCTVVLLNAQWSVDPSINIKIADTVGEQVMPKVVSDVNNGYSYISWFDGGTANQYNVYLQYLDNNGNKLWSADGLLVSDKQTMTWVTDYDLKIDHQGNAVITNQDIRNGSSDAYAWLISDQGSFLWGQDGISLTNDLAFNPSPKVAISDDGDYIFMWGCESVDTTEFDKIYLQKYSFAGTSVWTNETVIESDSFHCFMPYMIPTEDNGVIVTWIETRSKDTLVGSWPYMHPYVQKIDSNGNFVWAHHVKLDTLENMPLKPYMPSIISDGNGGCFIGWMAFPAGGLFYNSYVQHVDANGVIQWDTNGVQVCSDIQFEHANPQLSYDNQNDNLFVFFNDLQQYSGVDIRCGVYGQKFSSNGDRLWIDTGKLFAGLTQWMDTLTFGLGVTEYSGLMTLFYMIEYWDVVMGDTFLITNYHAVSFDNDGNFMWSPDERPVFASSLSGKESLVFSNMSNNQWVMAWADNRNDPNHEDETGIYAQNLSIFGWLGPVGIGEYSDIDIILNVYPNPVYSDATIEYDIQSPGIICINIYNLQGQKVQDVFQGFSQKGTHKLQFSCNELHAGIYLVRFASDYNVINKKILVIR